jgi:hypothetical protein
MAPTRTSALPSALGSAFDLGRLQRSPVGAGGYLKTANPSRR